MKPFLFTLFLFLSIQSADVNLAWDPSPTPGVTYTLVAHTNITNLLNSTNPATALISTNVGTNLSVRVNMTMPATWHFAVKAVGTNGFSSDLSNVVPVQLPSIPGLLRVLFP